MSDSQPKIPYSGSFRFYRSYPSKVLNPREKPVLESEFVQIIPNDYRFYSTLDRSKQDVRVAIILPGAWGSRLTCLLGETSLIEPNHPRYEGLSYCWGDLTNLRSIDILYALPDVGGLGDGGLDSSNIICADDPVLKGTLSGSNITRYYRQSYFITANLECALRYLRNENFTRFLWIDAICINQGHVTEKTEQVSMMKEIYEQAFQTVVWLDEGTEPGIESAVNFIYCLQDHLTKRTGLKKEELVDLDGPDISMGLLHQLFDEFEVVQDGLGQNEVVLWGLGGCALFFSLPWFRRVWVLQEVRQAPMTVIRCGHRTIGWGAVLHAAIWHKNRTSTYLGSTVDLQTLRTYFKEFTIPTLWINLASKAENTAMAMLIFYLPNFGSTDPRDRLFSIMGLAAETQGIHPLPLELRPDYLKPVPHVYTDFMRGMLKLQGKLDVLSTASRYSPTKKRQFLPDYPSWVPDFDTTNDVQSLLVQRHDPPLAKDVPLEIDEESPWNMLRLKGFVVDGVDEIVSQQTPALDAGHAGLLKVEANDKDLRIGNEPGAIYKIWMTKVRHLDPYPSKEDLLIAYLTCLHGGFFTGDIKNLKREMVEITSLNDETLADFAAYWKKYDANFADLPEHHRENLQRLSGSGNPEFLGQRLHTFCNGRCFLLTESGLMGLAPPGAEQGDLIVILGGGSVPYILRPKRHTTGPFDTFKYSTMKCVIGGGIMPCILRPMRLTAGSTAMFEASTAKCYEFIGECYVYGLTHESRLQDRQRLGRAVQMFDLV